MLLQYYSVLQTTTPVLLCTTKYYSSTTLHYTTSSKNLVLSTCVLKSVCNKCDCLQQLWIWHPFAQRNAMATAAMTFMETMARAGRKATRKATGRRRWDILRHIYIFTSILLCSRITTAPKTRTTLLQRANYTSWTPSESQFPPSLLSTSLFSLKKSLWKGNSPNTAPATKNESHDWSLSHMKRYLQCAEQHVSLSKLTKYCACHEKWISWLILVTHETLFAMRGGTSVIVQTHQILRLPRKMNLMIDPCHTWKAIYNAQSNKCHCPNSPNTAPATKNESHDWSLSHMKRYLQCAEQQVSLSKLTKYCACHAKWLSKILQKFLENSWNVISNAGPIRAGSELDPSRIRAGNRHPQPASQPRLLFRTTTSILYWKIQHFALRLSFQISPNTAPATKSDTSTSPNTAPATKSDTWTSPNNAPATKSDTWTSQNSDTNLISYESLLKRI